MSFILNPRLAQDSQYICALDLCQLRLHHNAAFPWVILVPQRTNKVELTDLTISDQIQLLTEISETTSCMQSMFQPHKMNIATLGNIVSQLHIHVIARFTVDKAWPQPVWNSGVVEEYQEADQTQIISRMREILGSI